MLPALCGTQPWMKHLCLRAPGLGAQRWSACLRHAQVAHRRGNGSLFAHCEPHERFLIDGILGLWRQTHMKCHFLVIEQACRDLVVMLRDRQPSSSDTFSSPTTMDLSRTTITLSSCNGASVSVPCMRPLCLASRHNARQGFGIVDHLLLHGPSVSGKVSSSRSSSCTMARSASGTTSCTITPGTGTRHFTICGMRSAISLTWSGVFTAVSCHGLTTHGSATMRDFDVSCGVLLGSLSVAVVCCGALPVSYPQPPWRTRHGCTHPCDASIQAG